VVGVLIVASRRPPSDTEWESSLNILILPLTSGLPGSVRSCRRHPANRMPMPSRRLHGQPRAPLRPRLPPRVGGHSGEAAGCRAPAPYDDEVVVARRRRARRPRSLRSTRPSSAAAASREARSSASSNSGAATADSWPMSRRIVISVLEAIKGSVTPSIQTRVRRPSPRSSPVIRSNAKIRSARANFPKPNATIRESDAT
jgi:hypothetical protein